MGCGASTNAAAAEANKSADKNPTEKTTSSGKSPDGRVKKADTSNAPQLKVGPDGIPTKPIKPKMPVMPE